MAPSTMPIDASGASSVQNPAKLSSILPTFPTTAGNLGVLPREIRDEIYRYVLGRTDPNKWDRGADVLLAAPTDSVGTTHLYWRKGDFPRILQLSTRIRQEAIEFIYSKAVFGMLEAYSPGINCIDMLDMNRIMNVRLWSYLFLEERLKVMSLFAGAEVLRETFAEIFMLDFWDEQHIIEPPMIEAGKQLTGFKSVALVFYWVEFNGQDDPDTRVDALIREFRRELEPALGPSTKQELAHYEIGLIFHPRDYLSRKSQAAKGELESQKKTT